MVWRRMRAVLRSPGRLWFQHGSSGSGDDITAGCALARAWKYGSRVARRPEGPTSSAETPPF